MRYNIYVSNKPRGLKELFEIIAAFMVLALWLFAIEEYYHYKDHSSFLLDPPKEHQAEKP